LRQRIDEWGIRRAHLARRDLGNPSANQQQNGKKHKAKLRAGPKSVVLGSAFMLCHR